MKWKHWMIEKIHLCSNWLWEIERIILLDDYLVISFKSSVSKLFKISNRKENGGTVGYIQLKNNKMVGCYLIQLLESQANNFSMKFDGRYYLPFIGLFISPFDRVEPTHFFFIVCYTDVKVLKKIWNSWI